MATNLFFDLWVLDAKQFTPTWCFLTSMTTDQSCLSFVKTDYVSVQIQNNVKEGHLFTNHQQHIVTTIIITAKGDCGELSTHVEELWWIPGLCCWSSASKRNWTSCSLRQVSLRAAEGKTIIVTSHVDLYNPPRHNGHTICKNISMKTFPGPAGSSGGQLCQPVWVNTSALSS